MESDKKLVDLRVVDLRAELEKRGLDRNGVKLVLMQRLKEALEEEGLDPDTHIFDSTEGSKKRRLSTQSGEKITTEAKPTGEENLKGKNKDDRKQEENEANSEEPHESEAESGKHNQIEDYDDPIRLTLDDETLHEVEKETAEKTAVKPIGGSADDTTKKAEDETRQETAESRDQQSGDARKAKESTQIASGNKSNPKVVWVSNVSQDTRAAELKAALSVYGKVVVAKIVVNARYPSSNCFGYVTLASEEDVENVISKLNNTELNGQMIKIEKFDQARGASKQRGEGPRERVEKKNEPNNTEKGEKSAETDANTDQEKSESKKAHVFKERPKPRERPTHKPYRSRSPGRFFGILTFAQIKKERELQKMRDRERILREESRRRQEERAIQKSIEKRQKKEAERLEKEKEKLRIEKEKIEREKAELMKMERERQRLEREKIVREKMELKRTLSQFEEDRRGRRNDTYEPSSGDRRGKRVATNDRYEPPPPGYEDMGKGRGQSPKSNKSYGSSSKSRSGKNRDPRRREHQRSGRKDRYERSRSPHGFRGSSKDERKESRYNNNRNSGSRPDMHRSYGTGPTPPNPWGNWRLVSPGYDRWVPSAAAPVQNRPFPHFNTSMVCPPPPGIGSYNNDNRFYY